MKGFNMKGRTERSWDDQPAAVEGVPIVAEFFAEGTAIEVRYLAGGRWFVSAGNLFGSQTIECVSAAVALLVIGSALKKSKQPRELPDGARLLEPDRPDPPGAN